MTQFVYSLISFRLLPLCCLLVFCVILPAQEIAEAISEQGRSEQNTDQFAQSESEARELGPKNAAYIEAFREYRALTQRLSAIVTEYQDARPARRAEIETEHAELFRQGLALHKRSIELALDAFDETPNRNPLVNDLLYRTVEWEFNRENYEESVRIFRRLASAGIAEGLEQFYVFAGLAAMFSMNYEEADEWLKIAAESGELARVFRSMPPSRNPRLPSRAETLQSHMQAMPAVREAWERELEIRKAEAEAAEQDPAKRLPRVELITTKGRIVLELFENEAPNTVANFISLVEARRYNDTVFHRVLPIFMAQGGCPQGTGRGGPGYTIDCEVGRNFPQARQHFRGSISMANTGQRNTNGSQFFLTFVPTAHLDGGHTVFGRVVEGIEVLADIQRFDPSDENAIIPVLDRIDTARVLNKRDHAYEVRRNPGR